MYISLNWIKDFVDLDGVDVINLIKNRFTLAVAEIEGIEEKGKDLKGVITAKIISVSNHPNSQKLHVLKVDTGSKIVDIVCGAPNVHENMIVPLAVEGSVVGGKTIGSAVLGGITSNGMCCSAKEIGISDDHSGLFEFPSNTPLGRDIKEILPIDDIVFEIDNKSLTNRPDLWGHYGIAREISALTGRPLKKLDIFKEDTSSLPKVNISVSSDTCFRYSSSTMSNINVKTSPMTMQIRLYYAGMRAINMLADVTNYVMLELGQPMHAFNNDLVKSIKVENISNDTKFVTLDNEERVLSKDTMVILGNNEISAVAGVMGGLDSEIKDTTSSVLIESACFHPAKVRRTATKLGLRTEASARYEKSLDPNLTMIALKRYMYLVSTIDSGAKVTSDITDVYNFHYDKKVINISLDYINNYIGATLTHDFVVDTLQKLEFEVKDLGQDNFEIHVPSFRATKDIQGKPDIVEEVARIYGYDNIKPKSCLMEVNPVDLQRKIADEYDIKYTLATKFDLSEIHTYLWYDSETNKVLGINPKSYLKVINSLQKYNDDLRSTLVPSQLKAVFDNKEDYSNFGIFEIGSAVVGLDDKNLSVEHKKLCITLYDKSGNVDKLLDLKEMIEYTCLEIIQTPIKFVPAVPSEEYMSPVNYYNIYSGSEVVGFIGLIHPRQSTIIDKKCCIATSEIDFTKLIETPKFSQTFEKVSKYPVSEMDFNFVISNDMLYRDIEEIANNIPADLDYKVSLLDVFKNNDNTTSYTLHFCLGRDDRTLTGEEIENFHKLVISTFERHGINLKA